MQILLATTNAGKYAEIQAFLQDLSGISLCSLQDFPQVFDEVEETGNTFKENALLKAQYYAQKTQLPTLAEDSGIEISALQGELGVQTRRWGAGAQASDEAWMEYFLNRMKTESDRSARFYCVACLCIPNAAPVFFEGVCDGHIALESNVPLQKGIPLSSYFIPLGFDVPFAALSLAQKNAISHRGKAIGVLKNYLSVSFCCV